MWRLEAGGVGSDYCSGCRQSIDPSQCTCEASKDDYGAPQIKVCAACLRDLEASPAVPSAVGGGVDK